MIISDTGADFEPVPTGLRSAVLVNVFDIGLQRGFRGDVNPECVFLWELADLKKDGNPFTVTRRYTASLNEKANLRRDLESWRGKTYTDEEIKAYNTDILIGINCRLNLVKKAKTNGKEYIEVAGVMKPEGSPTALKAKTSRTFIPDWVAKAIAEQVRTDEPRDQPNTPDRPAF
jgi:hypothetical protein